MVSAICIILLAISVSAISIAMRHFVVKLNERISDIKIELEHLDECVETHRDRVNNQLYEYFDTNSSSCMPRKTIRGKVDGLTEDVNLLKEYLDVEKVDTPASTKFVKRKGGNAKTNKV